MARFMDIAMGSGSELEYYFLMAYDLGYLDQDTHGALERQLLEVKRMPNSLMEQIDGEP